MNRKQLNKGRNKMTNRLQKIEKAINSMSDDRFVYANEY